MIAKRFGLRIKMLRLEANLSQEDFADLVGLHRTYIGMVERGEKNVSIKNIEKFAIAFDISVSTLFDGM
ncbi:MAG: helix-turn-helix transcriptional regulator [Candidatus Brocadiales bacterium]|nr:helix-turn-helix transcriptional regulator [Candidatus Brocadiales bacterium]